jgi:hydrogenase-4 component B
MTFGLLLAALGLLFGTALLALVLWRHDRASLLAGVFGCLGAAGLSLAAVALFLSGSPRAGSADLRFSWSASPMGQGHLGLDALSAFFLASIALVSALAALYASGSFQAFLGERRAAPQAAFFNLLVAGMMLVALARDMLLFLYAWEVMTAATFFLVTAADEREEARRAGIIFLIAGHVGLVFLLLLFGLLSVQTGSFDFAVIARAPIERSIASAAFLLAMGGFGLKAGFWPLHTWLPDTYPAAPSHVASVMSGTMSKLGIYGLLRTVALVGGDVPRWWGALLIAVGIASGLTGVLHALAQRDLKRLLAYSSVENIGIVALGLGLGLLGLSYGERPLAFLGFAGALLHVLNHGLFKGLLFQCAGSVEQGAGARDLDQLGGLLKKMPDTGRLFLVGAVAISGLPPLNGFASEYLIYFSAFRESSALPPQGSIFTIAALVSLALIGGLAAAAFLRAFGIAFLGEPRTDVVERAREPGGAALAAMVVGAALCLLVGLFPDAALALVCAPAASLAGLAPASASVGEGLFAVARGSALLLGLIAAAALLRRRLLRGSEVTSGPTWGCGYPSGTPRIQYTAASFSQPTLEPFALLMTPRQVKLERPQGYFPVSARAEEELGDPAGERLVLPAVRRLTGALGRLRIIQGGRVQLYLVYVFATLVVLLVWQLAGR